MVGWVDLDFVYYRRTALERDEVRKRIVLDIVYRRIDAHEWKDQRILQRVVEDVILGSPAELKKWCADLSLIHVKAILLVRPPSRFLEDLYVSSQLLLIFEILMICKAPFKSEWEMSIQNFCLHERFDLKWPS